MTELENTREQLNDILDRIPASGSFESAVLAREASKLADKITELCSHPDASPKLPTDATPKFATQKQ